MHQSVDNYTNARHNAGMAAGKATELDEVERRAAVALDTILNALGMPDQELADRLGIARQSINDRRNGKTRIRPAEMFSFPEALHLPTNVLTMERADVLRCVADHLRDSDTTTRTWSLSSAA